MDLDIDPIWILRGSPHGAYMDPYMDPTWILHGCVVFFVCLVRCVFSALGPLCLSCVVLWSVLRGVGSLLCLVCCVTGCDCVRVSVCVCVLCVRACACLCVCLGSVVSFVCWVRSVFHVCWVRCVFCVLCCALCHKVLGPSCALRAVLCVVSLFVCTCACVMCASMWSACQTRAQNTYIHCYTYTYVYIYIYIYLCIYVYIFTFNI